MSKFFKDFHIKQVVFTLFLNLLYFITRWRSVSSWEAGGKNEWKIGEGFGARKGPDHSRSRARPVPLSLAPTHREAETG